MDTPAKDGTRARGPVWGLLVVFYALWLVWVCLLLKFPALNAGPIRAAVRLAVWVGSAVVYLRLTGRAVLGSLRLTDHVGRGLAWGLLVAVVHLLPLSLFRMHVLGARFHWPGDWATWLNPVLTAPLAEEILFRGTVFQELAERMHLAKALVLAAALFALSHAPYWFLSGAKTGLPLAASLGEIFVYGLVFAGLFRLTRSLWSPIVYHTLNNLTSLSFGG